MIKHIDRHSPHRIIKILLPGLFVLLTACSTVQIGRDFNLQAFEEIASMAEMSKAQVKNLLGEPEGKGIAVEQDGERLDEWIYFYGTGQLPAMSDTTIKTLQIRFDKSGMIRSYNWSNSN